jgi:hypothetical protein
MRVHDVRADAADDARDAPGGDRVAYGRELAREAGQPHDLDARTVGDEGHRLLAARDVPCHESGLVAAPREPLRQVGHVQGGAAHVEPRDHAQNTDRAAVGSLAHARRA